MSPSEFVIWLEGYLDGAFQPDAGVIRTKMREVSSTASPVIPPGFLNRPAVSAETQDSISRIESILKQGGRLRRAEDWPPVPKATLALQNEPS